MQARLRRLQVEHTQVAAAFANHPRITLVATEGVPPEKYVFAYSVAGLAPTSEETFAPASIHRAEFFLPLDYPRRPPFCRMTTPVFHPNISPQKICIGDHWSAGQSLVQMVVRVGEMLCYQSYNLKSPLNARAAAWAEQNLAQLPLERANLSPALPAETDSSVQPSSAEPPRI
jgi:ubiquitin-protein ligase